MHQHYLLQALELAQLGEGFCAPNPSVGAVIVKNNEVIATGYHLGAGQAHAEVMALQAAGEQAQGASIYITLEPCCHFGRTPPCTDALISSGIGHVFYGYADPNPLVEGKSQRLLEAAGIPCQKLQLDEIDDFYEPYAYWMQHKTPWVTCKIAQTLDGKIANSDGTPRIITGRALQEFTHQQRLISDGILTTSRTVLMDDPQMNVRLREKTIAKPVYILDRTLILEPTAKLIATASKVVFFHGEGAEPAKKWHGMAHVQLQEVPEKNEKLCLDTILQRIGEQGCHRLWVESGGRCFNSLVQRNRVHQAFLYISPQYLGTIGHSLWDGAWDVAAGTCDIQWYGAGRDGICELRWPTN